MDEFSIRQAKAREMLQSAGQDALLASSEATIFYLTGATASRPLLILPSNPSIPPALLVSQTEAGTIAKQVGVPVVTRTRTQPGHPSTLRAALIERGLESAVLGIEFHNMTVEAHKALAQELPDVTTVSASPWIRDLRLVKSAREIEQMRRAAKVSDLAMLAAAQSLRNGDEECMAAAAAEAVMRKHGMFVAYETLIGSGLRSGMLRRYPSHVVPESNAVIRIDMAARYSLASGFGYNTDMTRSFTKVAPTGDVREHLEAALALYKATLSAIRPGRSVADVSREGLAVVKGTEFDKYSAMSGHGIGLEVHEYPGFNQTCELVLAEGMCFAIEPSIAIPNLRAVCYEDTIVVTADGHERLTEAPYDLWAA